MENTKKCLIVGLPNAGKSTYIGAFWAIEKDVSIRTNAPFTL